MQKVDKHISALLYTYDCVIVPHFGGFVSNYAPAKIHPVQHSFLPPSKSIVFNKNLKNNDGLLANYMANNLNIDYSQALKHIDQFVSAVNLQLKAGKKVVISDVGTIYWDVERNIQFEPSTKNYLLEAFGLVQFQSPAIKRDAFVKRIEKQLKDREPTSLPKKKKRLKYVMMVGIALPLIAALVWIPYNTNLLKNANYSNMNPFATEKSYRPVKEKKETLPESSLNKDSVITLPAAMPPAAPVTENTVTAVADTTAVVIPKDRRIDYKFHIVAGCFQIHSNAQRYVETLQQQHIPASIIGQNEKGLYVVSCGDFATRKEAILQLDDLKKQQENLWLYKN